MRFPDAETPDEVFEAFGSWAQAQGLTLYPHQEEAALALAAGQHVIITTPTGSGKSLVAVAGLALGFGSGFRSYYTAPIKALVAQKFFELVDVFGPENVGMLTGDSVVNPDADIIACTAEILANIALRTGPETPAAVVVMDEFHYYADPQRGWAWQVPLIELPRTQFLLMSATLGEVDFFVEDLERRTGRSVMPVTSTERPVPLSYSYVVEPVHEYLTELIRTGRAPVYLVHFTQAAAVERAQSLLSANVASKEQREQIAAALAGEKFATGFGTTLSRLLRHGIGVHHAGMLPRYRRLVERLTQAGLLTVVCGTDTLGVGINVPIRTVLFTSLTKFDGSRHRVLRVREFLQIAGRAGRAGYDTEGYVVVQAPEHVIDNHRALLKAGDDDKKRKKVQRKKPPEGFVVWTEDTFTKLTTAAPETLRSRMKVDNAMLVNVVAREEDAFEVTRRLLMDNHEDRRTQLRLARRALRLTHSLVASGVLTRLDEVDAFGRRYVLTVELPPDFALNQPLSLFAIAAMDLRWPLIAVDGFDSHLFEPVAQIVYRGNDTTLVGITNDGKKFRPSDWADRLCGVMSAFGADNRMTYSPYVRPGCTLKGDKTVMIDARLHDVEPPQHAAGIEAAQRQQRLDITAGHQAFGQFRPRARGTAQPRRR